MDSLAILETVKDWTPEARLELVARLWDQLVADGWQPEVTEELAAELDRRAAAHEADPTNVYTWDQVIKRVQDRQ